MADRLGGTGLQTLHLGGSQFFIKMCNQFLKDFYICNKRNCYKFLPHVPNVDFYFAPDKACHCGDTAAASSSNGAASSSFNYAKRRLDAQQRLREEQKNVSSDW